MDELKTVYDMITRIWKLYRKYGSRTLENEEWEELISTGQQFHEEYRQQDLNLELLFRDLFTALQNYYERLKTE